MKCPNCGYLFNAGTTCPSCGDSKIGPEELRRIERQRNLARPTPPKPNMICSKCAFAFNAGKTCPSCGHNDSEITLEKLAPKTQANAVNRKTTSMTCRKCGLRYDSGETCPSCGHTNIDPATQKLALANQINRGDTVKPEVICNKCGFRFNSGKTCPSCGHANSIKDPESRARNNPGNYVYRPKPKTWVLIVSIMGIIFNMIFSLVTGYLALLGSRLSPIFSVLMIVLLISSIASIFLFINLLRMKKWAVWALRILYTLNLIMLAIQGNFLSLQFIAGIIWSALLWFADWSDFD